MADCEIGLVSVHQPIARNFATASENKIHSDEIAQRMGFTGALVPGVTVFGHLAFPLTAELGTRWLESSFVSTRFLKPAYDGERLTIADVQKGPEDYLVECRNPSGELLATLQCKIETTPPDVDLRAQRLTAAPAVREEISWDAILIDEPFAPYVWRPDAAHNMEFAQRVDDDTPVFQQGILHPHAILAQANQALVHRFAMPAWIHVGSELRFRQLLRVGDAIEVRAVPTDKWEKRGHQFIKLYIALVVSGNVAVEVFHTAIFRIGGQ